MANERQQFADRAASKMIFYAKRVPKNQPRKPTIVRTAEQPKAPLLSTLWKMWNPLKVE
jgi:hypothetical protein